MNANRTTTRLHLVWLVLLALAMTGPARAASISAARNATVSAVLQKAAKPGTTDWVAIHFAMAPGWHTYWRNPGTAGYAATIDWTLPKGVSAGTIRWPVPERFVTGNIVDYGYQGAATLLVPLRIAADAALTSGRATAKISWLLCSDACVPRHAVLKFPLTGAFGNTALFKQAFASLPKTFSGSARLSVSQKSVALQVAGAQLTSAALKGIQFFPATPQVIDDAVAPRIARSGDGLRIVLARAKPPAPVHDFAGVLVTGDGRALSVHASAEAAPVTPPARASLSPTLLGAMLMALLGGLILNLMPCVLPILSMKALAIAQANESPRRMRRDGLFYFAGVVATFSFTAVSLIALKSAGAAIGWGFQLQSPFVVLVLCLATAAVGLNLLGAFELPLGFAGIGSGLAHGESGRGAFFTGVLAVLVASPCTAPFMGAALGYALTQPPVIALGVFLALGTGFAAPFTLFAFLPGASAIIPRPGPWMVRLKELLAFPMLGTSIWLLWVLEQETGSSGFVLALSLALALVFLMWLGRVPIPAVRWGVAAAGVAGIVAAGLHLQPASGHASRAGQWRPWSPQAVAAARASGHPVLVDFSAAWCITCLVNERVALDSPSVKHQLARDRVVTLKGDWTSHNATITAQLATYGRAGVPLYLLYPARSGAPTVLPQLLTPQLVAKALDRLSGPDEANRAQLR